MKVIALISTMFLLILVGCMSAEEYVQVEDSVTGWTSPVLKSVLDWFTKGDQLRSKGSYETAIMCYNKSIELDPSYEPAWVNKGFCLESLGKYDEALEAFDNATALNPLLSGVWYEKGELLLKRGDYDKAIKAYNISIELDPDYAYAWISKGGILEGKGMYQDAIYCYDEAIKCYDKPSRMSDVNGARFPWYYKGLVLQMLGRTTESNAAFAKAEELGYER